MTKRILTAFLLLFCLLPLVFACNGRSDGEGDDETTVTDSMGEETNIDTYIDYQGSDISSYLLLDGDDWVARHDEKGKGREESWYGRNWPAAAIVTTTVPGNFYTTDAGKVGSWWYRKTFTPDIALEEGMRSYIRFGAVDYYSEAYLNGIFIGKHEGKGVPFTFEATSAIKPDEENVLTVLVFQPCGTDATLDGMSHGHIPKGQVEVGGINRSVELFTTGAAAIEDIFVTSDWQSGKIAGKLTVSSPFDTTRESKITVAVSEKGSGACAFAKVYPVTLKPGENIINVESVLGSFKLWDLGTPNLYNVRYTLELSGEKGGAILSERTVRTGFRDFRVKDGWFFLNGERILLRSTHQGQSQPSYCYYQAEDDMARKDILNLKAAGFNCIRTIATPEQLDLCDELGLLVYQEHTGNWNWDMSGKEGLARFDTTLTDQIIAHRNHPSVVIWGVLNENGSAEACLHAKDLLSTLRKLDPTRLVFFNSGRFDRQLQIGSVSNPGSNEWEAVWGEEGKVGNGSTTGYEFFRPYYTGCGDIHIYPRIQTTEKLRAVFDSFGLGTKPVFVSEGGVGSAYNAIAGMRYAEQIGAADTSGLVVYSSVEEAQLRDFIVKYGFEDIYPVAEDYYTDVDAAQAKARKLYYDLIRSNPQIAGFSLTAALDEAFAGEGMFGLLRQFKKDQIEVLEQGNAPLRWCLFAEPATIYAGAELHIKAVLATEDVLPAGTYQAQLCIFSKESGIVWKKTVKFTLTEKNGYLPLAVTVFEDTILPEGLTEGTYTLSAELMSGGYARADRTEFTVMERENIARLQGMILTLGSVDDAVLTFVKAQGATVAPLDLNDPVSDGEVILVGKSGIMRSQMKALYERIACGAHAVFLYPELLTGTKIDYFDAAGEAQTIMTTAAKNLLTEDGKKATLNLRWQWLYHSNALGTGNDMLSGLDGRGVLDTETYGDCLNDRAYFTGLSAPDDLAVAEFGVGIYCYSTENIVGTVLGSYDFFAGSYTINGFALAENIGEPVADRLLANILTHAERAAANAEPISDKAQKAIDSFIK